MVIAVTGGSGFIGSHVVDKLIKAGYKVRVLDIIKPHRKDVEFVKVDILHNEKTLKALKGCTHIYHLAAVSNVNHAFEDPVNCVNVNILATTNLFP